jgi:16S rRNA (cytidine1402-2'-O)-methyltransferase
VTAALVASGFAAQPFAFFGFLPRKGRQRRETLEAIARFEGTVLLYEAPGRVARTLEELRGALGARRFALCRELTKLHEQVVRGVLGEGEPGALRGEVTLVIEGPDREAPAREPEPDAGARAAELLDGGMTPRDAALTLAGELGLPRREAYARVLEQAARRR